MAAGAVPRLARLPDEVRPRMVRGDWPRSEKSSAGPAGGGRTHTFGVVHPATKFKGKAVYERGDVVLRAGKPVPKNGG